MKRIQASSIRISTIIAILLTASSSRAVDTPPPAQLPWEHSSIITSDGSIRDDELAQFIFDAIPKAGGVPQVKDVKIFVQSCYGGGILDDIGNAFGTSIKWVGGAASAAEEPSWGPGDPTTDGDYWTEELVKAITAGGAGDTVGSDIGTANANDPARPGGAINNQFPQAKENPVLASGNGGDGIKWNDSTMHEIILFAGNPDGQRHINDLNKMNTALSNLLTGEMIQSSQTEGRTEQDLKDMITTAAGRLDPNKQLVLYFSDHGDTEFDVDEFLNTIVVPILPTGFSQNLPLHDGWYDGMRQAAAPAPFLSLALDETSPTLDPAEWQILFESVPLNLSGPIGPGQSIDLAIDPTLFHLGSHQLDIVPRSPTTTSLLLSNLELSSGGIETLVVPEPVSFTLIALGLLGMLSQRHAPRRD